MLLHPYGMPRLQEESIDYVASTIHRLMFPAAPGAGQQPTQQEQQQEQQAQQADEAELGEEESEGQGPGQNAGEQQEPGQPPSVAEPMAPAVEQKEDGQPRSRLFVISTYGVGKERILAAVKRRCGVRLHVAEKKLGVMQCLDLAGELAWPV